MENCYHQELKFVRDYACKAAGLDPEIAGWKTAVDAMTKQLADAQAQIEALQRDIDAERHVNRQQGSQLVHWQTHYSDIRRELDAEREKTKSEQAMTAGANERAQIVYKHYRDAMDKLTQLQALVRALPVVKGKLEVGSGVCYYVRALDGKENPVVCGLMTEQATAFAIKALLAYRAALDATTPAGGEQSGQRHPAFDEYGEHRQPTGLGDL